MNIVKRKGVFMTEDNAKHFNVLEMKFEIMLLPYAIRHDILSYVCERRNMPVFLKGIHGMPPTAVPLPTIARVRDRKLRAEAILVTIKQTTLEVHSGPGNAKLQKWLSSIDFTVSGETSLQSGFDAVHSLYFPYFSRYPHASLPANAPNNDIRLMLKCRNLRKLTLTFVYAELLDVYLRPKSIYQLRREYRLDSMLSMFQHGELQTIVLKNPSYAPALPALRALAAWFRGEFAVRANLHAQLAGSRTKSAKVLEVRMVL